MKSSHFAINRYKSNKTMLLQYYRSCSLLFTQQKASWFKSDFFVSGASCVDNRPYLPAKFQLCDHTFGHMGEKTRQLAITFCICEHHWNYTTLASFDQRQEVRYIDQLFFWHIHNIPFVFTESQQWDTGSQQIILSAPSNYYTPPPDQQPYTTGNATSCCRC